MAEVFSPSLQLSRCSKLALMLFVITGKSLSESGRVIYTHGRPPGRKASMPLLSTRSPV